MRHPLDIKQSVSEDHGTIGQWCVRIAVFYSVLSLLLVGSVAVEIKLLDPEIDAMRLLGAIGMFGMHDPAGASGALAPASLAPNTGEPRDPGSADRACHTTSSAVSCDRASRSHGFPSWWDKSIVRARCLLPSDCQTD